MALLLALPAVRGLAAGCIALISLLGLCTLAYPQSPAIDGKYIGFGNIKPATGSCEPITAVMMTIEGSDVSIVAIRVYRRGPMQYQEYTEYKGSSDTDGQISVNASKKNWPGSGSLRGRRFTGNIVNGALSNPVCNFDLDLHHE